MTKHDKKENKTLENAWDELVRDSKNKFEQYDTGNGYDNCIFSYEDGIEFARANIHKVPEVQELIEACHAVLGTSARMTGSNHKSLGHIGENIQMLEEALQKLKGSAK